MFRPAVCLLGLAWYAWGCQPLLGVQKVKDSTFLCARVKFWNGPRLKLTKSHLSSSYSFLRKWNHSYTNAKEDLGIQWGEKKAWTKWSTSFFLGLSTLFSPACSTYGCWSREGQTRRAITLNTNEKTGRKLPTVFIVGREETAISTVSKTFSSLCPAKNIFCRTKFWQFHMVGRTRNMA